LNHGSDTPCECIEGAQEYLRLLWAAVVEARQDVEADVRAQAGSEAQRRLEALRLVLYKLEHLEKHLKTSQRILNDLRTLRRLLLEERAGKAETPGTALSEAEVHELFQQLLAAAYTLQEHNDQLLLKEPKADFLQTLSDWVIAEKANLIPLVSLMPEPWAETEPPLESVLPMAPADIEPLASLNDSVLQPQTDARVPVLAREVLEAATCERSQSKPAPLIQLVQHAVPSATSGFRCRMVRRRISQSNKLFWRATTVVAMTMAAVLALLLGALVARLSPLPAGLALPSEVVQQQVPLQMTILPQSGGVRTRTIVMEPQATKTGPTETIVADKPPRRSATPASAQKTIINPNRHSADESEADMVARDTVVRYGTRSAAPGVQVQKKP
jgi:hypothetical protein